MTRALRAVAWTSVLLLVVVLGARMLIQHASRFYGWCGPIDAAVNVLRGTALLTAVLGYGLKHYPWLWPTHPDFRPPWERTPRRK